jgi:hypothetical protein
LQTIRNLLDLDANLIPSKKITRILKQQQQMGLEYDDKYLFQTDLELTTSTNTLDNKILPK